MERAYISIPPNKRGAVLMIHESLFVSFLSVEENIGLD
jgi:hypothetical protein